MITEYQNLYFFIWLITTADVNISDSPLLECLIYNGTLESFK